MHGFGFFPALLLPGLIFFGLLKFVFFVLIIGLIIRLVSHGGHHRHAYAGYGHGYGHGHGFGAHGWASPDADPRRIAAMRFAAGKIDRAEFDRIMAGLDASAPAAPPSAPTPPAPPVA